jgi:hypothetical protein
MWFQEQFFYISVMKQAYYYNTNKIKQLSVTDHRRLSLIMKLKNKIHPAPSSLNINAQYGGKSSDVE